MFLFSGCATRLQGRQFYHRLEQRCQPERPGRLLQTGPGTQLAQPRPQQGVRDECARQNKPVLLSFTDILYFVAADVTLFRKGLMVQLIVLLILIENESTKSPDSLLFYLYTIFT